VGGVLLAGSSAAQAGPLTSATLTISAALFAPFSFSASGLVGAGFAMGNGAAAGWSVAAGGVPGGATTITFPGSTIPPVSGLSWVITGNPLGGAFAAGSPGAMPVAGSIWLRGLGQRLVPVPLSIGVPVTKQHFHTFAGLGATAMGHSWTAETTTIALTRPTSMGATTAMATGANGLVGGGGTVVLVSALNLLIRQSSGPVQVQVPTFASLTLNYAAPEPGTLSLVGVACAGLLVLGLRKRR
jgi:hypothetical protein